MYGTKKLHIPNKIVRYSNKHTLLKKEKKKALAISSDARVRSIYKPPTHLSPYTASLSLSPSFLFAFLLRPDHSLYHIFFHNSSSASYKFFEYSVSKQALRARAIPLI